MLSETNIPETTACFGWPVVGFEDMMFDQPIVADRTLQIQAIITGNRCGHMPDAPRFFMRPEHHKQRPSVLDRAIDRLVEVYEKGKKTFLGKLGVSHEDGRQVRSERREAMAAILQTILHYLELSTLRVGFFAGSKFIHPDLKYLAKKAGISLSRTIRAVQALIEAGYITATRQFTKKEDGTFAGESSIRTVSPKLFIDLGTDMQQLNFAREHKRKKEEKEQSKGALKKLKGMMQTVGEFSRNLVAPKNNRYSHAVTDKDVEKKKALVSQAMALHQANSERSISEFYIELQRLKE